MMDDFLVFGKSIADPWRRVAPLHKPLLLMVEFCQIQGPRPMFVCPDDGIANKLLLEEIAIWLMSSENMHANLSSLYNQQIGIYVQVLYATMLDITARALQRPFALAYISTSQPSDGFILEFQQIAMQLLLPLLSCNRNYLHSVIGFASQMVENCEMRNFQSYYSTAGNAQQIVILSNKIRGIVQQAKPWYDRFVEKIYAKEDGAACSCECNEEDFRKFAKILASRQTTQLTNLMELSPCAGKEFFDLFTRAYQKCSGNAVSAEEGLMFSGNVAVNRSTFGPNSKNGTDAASPPDSLLMRPQYPFVIEESALKTLSFRLVRILYPLLAGERIVILASQQRITTGMDLLNKLNALHVTKRCEGIEWNFSKNSELNFGDSKLVGISCDREESLKWSAKESDECEFVVVDLNNHRIKCRPYSGIFLDSIAGSRNFPSDIATLHFIAATITDIFQFILLAKYISPEAVSQHFGLSKQDESILYNFLIEFNLTRFIRLKAKIEEIQRRIAYQLQSF